MFNRTTYNKETNHLADYIENPSIKYKRRMSGNNRPIGTLTKRGFSGFHEPEAVSVTKMKEFSQMYAGPIHATKPILSSFRKKQDRPLKLNFMGTKGSFRQTAVGFSTNKQKQKVDERFYQTAVNGFGLHNRPMSKQQPRNNKNSIKQIQKQKDVEQQFQLDDGDSNIQDMDEDDRIMVLNFQKLNNLTEVIHKEDRPQTSKGFRKKMTSSSDLEVSMGENLFDELKSPSKFKEDNYFNDLKIPIRNMYNERKSGHPSSAHPKTKGYKHDDMFKVTTSSPKKNSIDISAPFESLIGSEFLSLFANGKN